MFLTSSSIWLRHGHWAGMLEFESLGSAPWLEETKGKRNKEHQVVQNIGSLSGGSNTRRHGHTRAIRSASHAYISFRSA
jgi:hypothetical protein